MKYLVDFLTAKKQNPDFVYIKLNAESEAEKKLLHENTDTETIELYYHDAVKQKLAGYVLLEVVDDTQWPYAAQCKVQRV